MSINLEHATLVACDGYGIYIPQYFAKNVPRDLVSGVSEQDWAILEAGPDHEWHWDTWDDVLRNAVITDDDGIVHYLYQNGDLWLVPEDATNDNNDDEAE